MFAYHLHGHLACRVDGGLLVCTTLDIALTTLLVEELARFAHSHTHELGLASTTLPTAATREHLQCLLTVR